MDRWVHVHAKCVTDTANLNVLIKRIVVAILSQQPDVTFAVSDLVVAGCVIRNVGVGHILNVAHHTVEDFCYLYVSVVIRGYYFTVWTVLTLFVGYLTDVLWQLVDCQAWTCVDSLTLHTAAG